MSRHRTQIKHGKKSPKRRRIYVDRRKFQCHTFTSAKFKYLHVQNNRAQKKRGKKTIFTALNDVDTKVKKFKFIGRSVLRKSTEVELPEHFNICSCADTEKGIMLDIDQKWCEIAFWKQESSDFFIFPNILLKMNAMQRKEVSVGKPSPVLLNKSQHLLDYCCLNYDCSK